MAESLAFPGTGLDRRAFLRHSAVGLGLALAPGAARANEGGRVVVVGAGLAGLAAADELARAGAEALVIESSNRPGGRIHTLRGHFADGLEPEAGGDEIGASYRTVMRYVRELGLSVVPGEGPARLMRSEILVELGDHMLPLSKLRAEPGLWGEGLTPEERGRAPFGLLFHYVGPLAREMAEVERILDPKWLKYDALSLDQLLVERGASRAARRLIDVALNYDRVETVSALNVLRDIARRFGDPGSFHIEGGNDQLPTGLAARLGEQVHYGVALRKVAWAADGGVQLTVERRGHVDELEAARVVLAIPFTALRRVVFEPGLPEVRQRAIHDLPYTQVTKTYVQARRRFWEKDLGVAAVWSDGAYERIFGSSLEGAGSRALLLSWLNGTGARELSKLAPEEQARRVVANMARVFPGHAHRLEHGVTVDWSREPSEGAYAHFAPGQIADFGPTLSQPVGPLHFAGEHTEILSPGMEAALLSGHRAAREILGGRGGGGRAPENAPEARRRSDLDRISC